MSIRSVGGVPVLPRHRLTCHCGAVAIELELPDGIVDPRRCDCSICRRKGAIVASVPLSGIRIVRGEEHLRLYQFNTRVARHYFCGLCGIHTHHQRRSFPDQYGYNVGCLEGINPFLLDEVPVNDGVNHPADRGTDRRRQMAAKIPEGAWMDSNMDPGKVTVKIPADLMTLEAAGAVADRIRVALHRAGLGDVVSCEELTYEPFTPDTAEFGRKWHQIVLNLDRALASRRVADLLLAAGAPPSAHITYTDQMRLCGASLGRG